MYKLIRFYNQNKKKVLRTILIIVFIIIVIQLLNQFYKNKNVKRGIQYIDVSNNVINQELISDKSAISGQKVSSNKLKDDTDIINQFVEYCNEKNIEGAYNLLSKECKENMFPSIEDFNNIYYLKLFDCYKTHTIQNWTSNIYLVKFTGNIATTGDLSNNQTNQDYITIVEENKNKKLNINGFIKRQKIDKEIEKEKISVKVEKVDVYMDFCIYTFDVKNNSYRTILLDDLTNINSMYIQDSNSVNYSAYTHEITQERLNLGVSQEKKIDIKYYSKYSSSKDIKKIFFSNVINDYERYGSLKDKNKYGKYLTIGIEL